jgi:ankyrin repeat protein
VPVSNLPSDPSLEQLKKLAKTLQRAVRSGDPEALAVVSEFHPGQAAANFTLANAQLVLARQFGFPSWPKLRHHLDVVSRYSRSPHRRPEDTAAEPREDTFLRLACLTYGDDHPDRIRDARQLLADHPKIGVANIYTMAAVGEVASARALLDQQPELAVRQGGPFNWEPLLYLAYSRVESGHSSLPTAELLLDRGADPNAGYLWEGLPSPFTALTGALGGGESAQPPHRDHLALARLLLQAGADANDSQALYNLGLAGPAHAVDDYLELLLEHGLGRGSGGPWHERLTPAHPSPAQLLIDELGNAAMKNLVDRVRLLIDHGVDVDGRPSHPLFKGRSAYEVAVHHGNAAVVDLLAAAGATPSSDDLLLQAAGAFMRGDRTAIERLRGKAPTVIEQLISEEPDLIVEAAANGKVEALRLMVDQGFNVNFMRRKTALHDAAWNGDLQMVKVLVELGADPTIVDREFQSTPAGWAEHAGQDEVAEYLNRLTER